MKGPQTIEELVERLVAQAKRLPTEQAQTVASCLEHALRGSQDDALYDLVDSIFEHTNKPQKPLVQIETMTGNINALENKEDSHDNPNQQSKRGCKHLQQ